MGVRFVKGPPLVLERYHEAVRQLHDGIRTEDASVFCMKRLILFRAERAVTGIR